MIFGLLMGAYYNWTVVAPRLRVYTERLNVLTIPSILKNDCKQNLLLENSVFSYHLGFSHFTRLRGLCRCETVL